jgi:hypothetical protein
MGTAPLLIPFAHEMRSGVTPRACAAKGAPSLPRPVTTSSKISRMPCLMALPDLRLVAFVYFLNLCAFLMLRCSWSQSAVRCHFSCRTHLLRKTRARVRQTDRRGASRAIDRGRHCALGSLGPAAQSCPASQKRSVRAACQGLHGNPHDGHTLGPVIAEKLTGMAARRIHGGEGLSRPPAGSRSGSAAGFAAAPKPFAARCSVVPPSSL